MKLSALISALPLLVVSAIAAAQPAGSRAEGDSISLSIEGSIPIEAPAPTRLQRPDPIEGSVPIEMLIKQVAEDMGREFVIDQRVAGVMAYSTSDDIDYESLLGILRINNLVALEAGDQILVMSAQNVRSGATRLLQEDDPRVSDNEIVTRIITIPDRGRTTRRNAEEAEPEPMLSAQQLVPVLRPMIPQEGQLGAVAGTNSLIIVDHYDNVRRITAVIEEILEGLDD